MRAALVAVACALLLPAAPAPAAQRSGERIPLVAYGEGTTRCTVFLSHYQDAIQRIDFPNFYDFLARTTCDAAVDQSGRAWRTEPLGDTVYGPLCSGVTTSCESARAGEGWGRDPELPRAGPCAARAGVGGAAGRMLGRGHRPARLHVRHGAHARRSLSRASYIDSPE